MRPPLEDGAWPSSPAPLAAPHALTTPAPAGPPPGGDPLSAEELQATLRRRWRASYDLQLVQRRSRLYLQVMWGYLEQQSFPLDAEAYAAKLADLVASLNGLGVAAQVRDWLNTTSDRPRLGKAMSLALALPPGRASEFLL